ncbi:hypothetical protein [Paractinoplanes atraurantiacus]|uniref:Uncharacterized protein n=1 Tax=Paractinoplanes atraurantiacus TaxID=1036182 RepID=A0A285HFS0_9ACTN|nr:hypothetical protein [Actinoplanes atraurantiacus]SNY34592.1 hypothetical protein SAMN05421748_104306 [Actinoplanes atraurantiacus]
MEKVRLFLGIEVADAASLDEVRWEAQQVALTTTRGVRQDLTAIESVLAEQHAPGALLHLVEGYGNRRLPESTDEAAAAFLAQVAGILRSVIAEAEQRTT